MCLDMRCSVPTVWNNFKIKTRDGSDLKLRIDIQSNLVKVSVSNIRKKKEPVQSDTQANARLGSISISSDTQSCSIRIGHENVVRSRPC